MGTYTPQESMCVCISLPDSQNPTSPHHLMCLPSSFLCNANMYNTTAPFLNHITFNQQDSILPGHVCRARIICSLFLCGKYVFMELQIVTVVLLICKLAKASRFTHRYYLPYNYSLLMSGLDYSSIPNLRITP